MPAYCNAEGCNSSSKKKENLVKYPWMKDITFHSFPSAQKQKHLRKLWIDMVRRGDNWMPNKYSRLCSIHFVGLKGPSPNNPIPTLFQYNDYGGMLADKLRKPPTVRNTPSANDLNPPPSMECDDGFIEIADSVPDFIDEISVITGNYHIMLIYSFFNGSTCVSKDGV